ncbi:DinB family protein [Bacillus sp. A301a_S52]|nr:DinB family protein [Bacillus sp. A301a_S52]
MTLKTSMLAQLKTCHRENAWYVATLNAIDELTEEQAMWKPQKADYSIFELTNHIIYYSDRYLKRFKGTEDDEIHKDNTFKGSEGMSWYDTVERLTAITSEWVKVVGEADEQKLADWAVDIAHLTTHTAYHTGQMVVLRKWQHAWHDKNGVKYNP